MSVRVVLCFAYVIFFSFYAWRNWLTSACAAVVLMAFFQHPDMPKNLGGIQGANPWNILVGNVTLAWLTQRGTRGLTWDMPPWIKRGFLAFSVVILWTFLRLAANPTKYLVGYTFLSGFSDYFINNVKWLLIATILFDTCRSRREIMMGLGSVLALYFLLAVQVIRWIPLSFVIAGEDDFAHIAYKLIQNEIGYNRVTLSMMLGGASWATLAFLTIVRTTRNRIILLVVFLAITLGQALTGGRTGYVSWAAVGLIFCTVRWRKLLIILPIIAMAVMTFLPAVRERILFGVGDNAQVEVGGETGTAKLTSGRTIIWPYVLEKIGKSPLIGYGRMAMMRTGLTDWLFEYLEEDNFGHPHNAYLEQLFDNGIVGFVFVVPLYFFLLRRSFRLFIDNGDPLFPVAGGVACALILALMVGALAGETFYPREGSAGMWAAIGLMLRASVESVRLKKEGIPPFGDPVPELEVTSEGERIATPVA